MLTQESEFCLALMVGNERVREVGLKERERGGGGEEGQTDRQTGKSE